MDARTINQIRQAHDDYVSTRKVFDDKWKGIISPIRVVDFPDEVTALKYFTKAAKMDSAERLKFWHSRTRPIGYFAAAKGLHQDTVHTGWSVCSAEDLFNGEFDKETGIQLATNRALRCLAEWSINNLHTYVYAENEIVMFKKRILYFGITPKDQAAAFLNRCKRYYKLESLEECL